VLSKKANVHPLQLSIRGWRYLLDSPFDNKPVTRENSCLVSQRLGTSAFDNTAMIASDRSGEAGELELQRLGNRSG